MHKYTSELRADELGIRHLKFKFQRLLKKFFVTLYINKPVKMSKCQNGQMAKWPNVTIEGVKGRQSYSNVGKNTDCPGFYCCVHLYNVCIFNCQRPYAMLKAPVPSITVVKQH
jgi:hypothetical protein